MSNMSYCRFQNTKQDFEDCVDALEEMEGGGLNKLSAEEKRAAERLAALAVRYIEAYESAAGE